ncbi:MAG TPA: M3 family metallopeptidase [Polyangiaceae bacterium]|nr:M3 family metallopeptidase [Polyangiaceae bacterium]
MSDNPLLRDEFPIRFDEVRPEHVRPAVDALLAEAESRLAAAGRVHATPTFENTMLPIEAISDRLDRAMRVVQHLEAVSTSDALREVYNDAQPRVSEFHSRIPLSAPVWEALARFAESEAGRALSGPRKRFVEKTVASFRRHGAGLDEAGKQRLSEIDVELTRATLRYSQNVLDSTNAFELIVEDEAKLAGLPESARQAAEQSARDKGKRGWRFTLQAPSYIPILTYLHDRSIRERVYRAAMTRATRGEHDNRAVVDRILELRRERGVLLGYQSFADLALEDRMAKSATRARSFVDDLRARTDSHFTRETAELAAFRRELEGESALEAWDVPYYAEKLRHSRYQFDEEELRSYFQLERVLGGLFSIAERLYGVRFEPWTDAPVWHSTVRAFKLLDANDGSWRAGIYVDPFPRESKQGGAWMDGLVARGRMEADRRQLAVLVSNVAPPIGGRDALLSHDEVQTMFHEFGHLMHHCLTKTELRSQAGTQVAWDFVELPSQIMENWCWERDALDLFARHVDSGAPIPDALLSSMQRARTYRAASAMMRQLSFATVDLKLHTEYDPKRDGDVFAYARTIMQAFSPTALPEDYAMIAAFEHLFGGLFGYAASYYSYKWAEVLDADAFTRFKREGLLERPVGRAFAESILERGDEEDPSELFQAFMGRAPDLTALLDRLGLSA